MPWNRYLPWFYRMLELTMTSDLPDLNPSVIPKHLENFSYLHRNLFYPVHSTLPPEHPSLFYACKLPQSRSTIKPPKSSSWWAAAFGLPGRPRIV